jgi:hypothetical protein
MDMVDFKIELMSPVHAQEHGQKTKPELYFDFSNYYTVVIIHN